MLYLVQVITYLLVFALLPSVVQLYSTQVTEAVSWLIYVISVAEGVLCMKNLNCKLQPNPLHLMILHNSLKMRKLKQARLPFWFAFL